MELSSSEIIAAIVALVSFIVALLKVIRDSFKETKDRMVHMEERHRKQNDSVIDLTGKVNKLEGERVGFMLGAEKVSNDVINELRKNNK